jgi:hypothetical protein
MTVTAETPPAPAPAGNASGDPAGGGTRARLRRARWPLAVAGLVVLVAVVGALLVPRTTGEALDPDSATPQGARAVAQILRREGVRVDRVRHLEDAVRGAVPGATLVIVDPHLLGPDQLDRLAAMPPGADLVLVAPDAIVLNRLAPQVRPPGWWPRRYDRPAVPIPDARAAGPAGGRGCSTPKTAGSPATTTGAILGRLAVRTSVGGRQVTVLGQRAQVLTNAYLAEDGNAAPVASPAGARPRRSSVPPRPARARRGRHPPAGVAPRWVGWVTLQPGLPRRRAALALAPPRPSGHRTAAGRGPGQRDPGGARPAVPFVPPAPVAGRGHVAPRACAGSRPGSTCRRRPPGRWRCWSPDSGAWDDVNDALPGPAPATTRLVRLPRGWTSGGGAARDPDRRCGRRGIDEQKGTAI